MRALLAANAHLGHHTSLIHSRAIPFVAGHRASINIIDLNHTLSHLRRASLVVRRVAYDAGNVVFIGTRKNLAWMVQEKAASVGAFVITKRWIPGLLTNGRSVMRAMAKRTYPNDADRLDVKEEEQDLDEETMMVYEDGKPISMLNADTTSTFSSSKSNSNNKTYAEEEDEEDELGSDEEPSYEDRVAGIYKKPDLLVLLNPGENKIAIREAHALMVPTIGIIDTDQDPTQVTYPIPANDDAPESVGLILSVLVKAFQEGREARELWRHMNQRESAPVFDRPWS